MMEWAVWLLRPLLALAAVIYIGLAVRVARSSPQHANSVIAFFLLLVGTFVAGSAFYYGTDDYGIFAIGRVLVSFSSAFLPVAFYIIYREYTEGPPNAAIITLVSAIPIATTLLALTNPIHGLLWTAVVTENGTLTTVVREQWWFNRVQAPFMYGLFLYSAIAMIGRLPTLALPHRKTILLMLACAVMPLLASVANIWFNVGPPGFPISALSFVFMLPLYAYASISMRFYEFSPIAYQTLFDHVRDPIFVLDHEERIVCANKSAQELLGGTERELIGHKLWDDFPEARDIVRSASELDLTQTLRLNKDNIYELSVGTLKGPKGQSLGMVVVCRDVTERRQAQAQLADSEHLIRTLIETSSNGILRFARDRDSEELRFRCIFANRASENYLNHGNGTLVGTLLDKLTQLEPDKLIAHFKDEPANRSTVSYETAADSVNGESWLRIVGEPVGEDFSVTLIDITQRKRDEDKMLADALRDPLTGVLNRRGFEKDGNALVRSHDIG
ncbi:MAG: histidine kinase N-terminal 7TM domain-containing protein, partial [Woeseiaceae bacterium]